MQKLKDFQTFLSTVFGVSVEAKHYFASAKKSELHLDQSGHSKVEGFTAPNLAAARESLVKHGLAVVPNVMASSKAADINQLLTRAVDAKDSDLLVVQGHEAGSYHELAAKAEPTAVIRSGEDEGMIDIFHVDRFLESRGFELHTLLPVEEIENELSAVQGQNLRLRNANAYINRSVVSTRGFHVDSFGGRQFKVFLYLTDVSTLSEGPYTYIPGTAGNRGFEQANRAVSRLFQLQKTDITIVDWGEVIPLLAPAGTMIVSNQSGAHRGWPQSAGAERCLLALNLVAQK